MHKTIVSTFVAVVLVVGMSGNMFAEETKHEFDMEGYTKIAKNTIKRVIKQDIDVDAMLVDMKKLVEIGVAGCKEHMGEAETPEVEKKLMKLCIDNAEKMSAMSLEEIEAQWHDGEAITKAGLDVKGFDHFGEAMCHADGVIHPATAIICLNAYKKDQKQEHLDQVKDELSEVVSHFKHLSK